jgi:hypothetical protein
LDADRKDAIEKKSMIKARDRQTDRKQRHAERISRAAYSNE